MTCFFVGGSQRSGTTLLQTILCQDESVNPLIQEAKYLRHLVTAYRFGKHQFKAETKDYFKNPKAYYAFNARMVRTFIQNTRAQFPKAKHLVLREPHLTVLFPELAELLPKAKFLCIVRDPRDVLASMIKVGARLKDQGTETDIMSRLFLSRDIPALCRHYLSFYGPALKAGSGALKQRLLLLRYEDLVGAPEAEVAKVREFTGIGLKNFDPGKNLETGRVDFSKLDKYRKAWTSPENSQKITDTRIGTYKEVLSEAECAAVTENCRKFMERFKYT